MNNNQKNSRKKKVVPKRGVPLLSVKRISQDYEFHPNTIRRWVKEDGLRHVRRGRGGKILIRTDDIERFIKQWYEID